MAGGDARGGDVWTVYGLYAGAKVGGDGEFYKDFFVLFFGVVMLVLFFLCCLLVLFACVVFLVLFCLCCFACVVLLVLFCPAALTFFCLSKRK